MNGRGIADIKAIQKTSNDFLRAMPANDLKSSFENKLSRTNQCIEGKGDYLSKWNRFTEKTICCCCFAESPLNNDADLVQR